jgi:flagellar motor switch protein FliG
MEPVSRETLLQVEATLKAEFMSNLARSSRRDAHEAMADVFNALDRSSEERLLGLLEQKAPEAAERIRQLMFTFNDLINLPPQAMQLLVRRADKAKIALALKGASDEMREHVLKAMAARAASLLRDALTDLGPQRMRDVEQAQADLVRLAKSLADAGDIVLADSKVEEELVY